MIKFTHFIELNSDNSEFINSEPYNDKSYGYVAPKKEIDSVLLSISDRIKEDTKPFPANTKVYLGKTCKLERNRIKAIFDSSDFSKTRVVEYADVIVLDKIYETMSFSNIYFLNKERIDIITHAFIDNGLQSLVDSLLSHAGPNKSISIYYNTGRFEMLLSSVGILKEQTQDWLKPYYIFNGWGDSKIVDMLNNSISCNLNEKAQILDSKAFNGDILQKDRIVIDAESYDSYCEMAYSEQLDDTIMLANLIDNCNIKKSHYYINLLAMDNILFGSGKLAAHIKSETYKYLEAISKKHFSADLTTYGVKYALPRLSTDKEYKNIPQTKINQEKYILHLVQEDLKNHGWYWIDNLGYSVVGLENITIKPKINLNDAFPF
jgi:hypothetical protein